MASALLGVNIRALARDFVVSGRPAQKFSGARGQDCESFLNQFNKVVNIDGVTDDMKFRELQHWVVGTAATVVSQYENDPDSTQALAAALAHLEREYGRKAYTAKQMLQNLLTGPKFNESDHDSIQTFLIKLEKTHKIAVETSRSETFATRETCSEVIRKKLPHMARKWSAYETDLYDKFVKTQDPKFALTFTYFIDSCKRLNKISRNQKDILQSDTTPAANPAGGGAPRNHRAKVAATAVSPPESVEAKVAASTSSRPHDNSRKNPGPKGHGAQTKPQTTPRPLLSAPSQNCIACGNGQHALGKCREFLKMTHQDKQTFVKRKGLCFLCLTHGHVVADCPAGATIKCPVNDCGARHNAVFHRPKTQKPSEH